MRHVPVQGSIPLRSRPKQSDDQRGRFPTATQVRHRIEHNPAVAPSFVTNLQQCLDLQQQPADLDSCIRQAWMTTVGATTQTQSVHIVPESVSFKSFWQSKKNLRTASGLLGDFTCPLVLNVACANLGAVARLLPYASSKLSRLFRAWRAASSFASQERIIRQRTRERKAKQFDSMLEEAMAASKHGITGLRQLLQRWKPKSSKRSIHFRNADGSLMDQKAELLALKSYFSELYQSAEKTGCAWILQEALPISREEVRNAFHALSARKALPPKQAPALLWKIASDVLVPCMHYQLQRIFSAGRITFPEAWHEAFLALLPKVGKAPTKATKACNLRPISLLPAAPKLVAKILADKLRPYLQQALQSTPQFAYQQDRQTGDALDRVLSHCLLVRSKLQDHRSSVFSRRDGRQLLLVVHWRSSAQPGHEQSL